jgi:hypothetical protein
MSSKTTFDIEQMVSSFSGDTAALHVNGHVHSPYSFCSFDSIEQMFRMANDEKVSVLGINDFFSMDGYSEFNTLSKKYKVYPQFNVEFIGLLSDLQAKGVRINDPNNPGRIYFSGKGLSFPLNMSAENSQFLNGLVAESQRQIKEMTLLANALLKEVDSDFGFTYEEIKSKYAKELVRERHIGQAIREQVFEKYTTEAERKAVFTAIYGGKEPKSNLNDIASVENELRGMLLKSGGKAFVAEDPAAFPPLERIIRFIVEAGGIPCYPVLLDDRKGNILTEFESPDSNGNWDEMHATLQRLNVHTVELIPSRNSVDKLREFVQFFMAKGYVVFLGSEHNTPGIFPVEVKIDGDKTLPKDLVEVSYKGACLIAAHQELVKQGKIGYVNNDGTVNSSDFESYVALGNAIIKSFIA